MKKRRTKIICTIGPATCSEEMIVKLIDNGMNVARLNFSHGTHKEYQKVIQIIKKVREEKGVAVGILLDTKGPEIRVGDIEPKKVCPGEMIQIGSQIPIVPSFIVDEVQVGVQLFFDDGYIHGKVVGKGEGYAEVVIENEGILKKNKGVNIPEQVFDLPDLTEKDVIDIQFGCREGIDMIALSFVRSAKQIVTIKKLLAKENSADIFVIAKIESKEGVRNFEEIVQVADGIMVARGDLGIELFVAHLPPLQKKMIQECNLYAKPVIIATQMLESMIQSPMPTRAEASDVANAIYDAASAVMLSGETAIGFYPIQALKMMHEIVCEAESNFDYKEFFRKTLEHNLYDIPSGVVRAAVNTCYTIQASALIVCSNSGKTVRRICCFRPKAEIIAVTPSLLTYYQTSLLWGTTAYREKRVEIEKEFDDIACYALKKGLVRYGDLVVVTMGKPYGISFTTNTLYVESIGKALVRGQESLCKEAFVSGEVLILFPGEEKDVANKIVVTTQVSENQIEKLSKAKAIILQNHPLDSISEMHVVRLFEEFSIPYIFRADAATLLLKNGMNVRVEAPLGIVFKGDSPTEAMMLKRATC